MSEYLTLKELAVDSGYSLNTIYKWSSAGKLKRRKSPKGWLISKKWFYETFLNREPDPNKQTRAEKELDKKAEGVLIGLELRRAQRRARKTKVNH